MTPMKGAGCERCNQTGYKGRVGLYEVMEISEELRELILVGASGLELRRKAVDEGMLTLRQKRTAQSEGRRDDDRRGRQGDGEMKQMATLPELLKTLVELDGSDLHITTHTPPQVRVHGHLQRLQMPELTPAETKQLVYSVLTDAQKKRFEETMELDFSFGIKGLARFRCNVFNQRGAVGAVYRLIPEKIRSFSELGLPPVLADLAERPRGLVLVTGPTGSGKSTTLAAMIDKINTGAPRSHPDDRGSDRVHPPAQELPGQSARGPQRHRTVSRTRCAPRCARIPDIVLIGEMRDLETVEGGAEDRRNRPLDVRHAAHQLGGADDQPHHRHLSRPASRRRSARSCRWCSRGSSVRRCCRRPTARAASRRSRSWCRRPRIRNLIRDDKVHQIYGAMQTGQEKLGMQTANQSLASLYMKRLITLETALTASSNKDELQDMINRGVGVVAGAGLGRGRHAGARPVARRKRNGLTMGELRDDMPTFAYSAGRARPDGQRRTGGRHRWTPPSPRCGASRSGHADHAGQGQGRGRQGEARRQDRQDGRRRRTWRCSPGSSR